MRLRAHGKHRKGLPIDREAVPHVWRTDAEIVREMNDRMNDRIRHAAQAVVERDPRYTCPPGHGRCP